MRLTRINDRDALKKLAEKMDVRKDWHEPDEQNLRATVVGNHLDNAMGPSIYEDMLHNGYHEFVVLLHHGVENYAINLATLLSWAAE